ncbi:MAG: MATE family efflux transporter [Eubacterium sp.]|nr:MATE family efflux transporter [Eubacterium sp.]
MKKWDTRGFMFTNTALVVLFIPLIIEQFLNILVGLLDSLMIAHVGEAAVSGVSLVDSCFNLLIMLFFAVATGGAVVAGQYLGRKDKENASRAANQNVWFMLFVSLVVMGCVYLGQNLILNGIFGQIEPDVEGYARTYLLIVSASIPFLALYSAAAALFRSMGNSKTPMKISMLMNFINFGGNALCIFGLHMGSEGVAIPTLCSRVVSAVVLLCLLKNPNLKVHLPKKLTFHWDGNLIKSILIVALPNGIENSMFHVGKIAVLSLVSSFGTYAIAANAVANTMSSFQVLAGSAAQLAIVAVVSQCLGAGEHEQAKYYTIKIHKMTYLGMLLFNAVIWGLMPLILHWYDLSEQATHAALIILIMHGVSSILVWPTSFVMPCIFRASGDGKYSMTAAIITMFAVRVFMSYVFGALLGFGVIGVWMATVLDECARSVLYVARFRSGKWLQKKVIS